MTTAQEEPKTGIRFIDKIFFDAETNRYGIISMLLIAVGCLGGVGVGTGGLEYTVELILLVASTMFSLAMILAVAPMKWILYSSFISILLSITCIVVNLFFLV
jgi:hypothetical protein